MARFVPPANILLRRAQLTLVLATLLPTIVLIALGIVLLAIGDGSGAVVAGVLVLALCSTTLTGYVLGSIFVSKGAALARTQNDFLSAVSHELKTPLTSTLIFIETLRDDRLTDPTEKKQCLALLHQEVKRLDALVARLLTLSQLEAGSHAFHHGPVDVRMVVSDAIAALDAAAIPEKIALVREMPDEPCYVTADQPALAQAVGNLLINAWKYTEPKNRKIGVRVAGQPDYVDITIWDNGPGISPKEQKRIFQHFERGGAGMRSGKTGSGLGLAIAREIVKAHNGRLEVISRGNTGKKSRAQSIGPGAEFLDGAPGAEFRIRLPTFLHKGKLPVGKES